jgi:hypothetical protein
VTCSLNFFAVYALADVKSEVSTGSCQEEKLAPYICHVKNHYASYTAFQNGKGKNYCRASEEEL